MIEENELKVGMDAFYAEKLLNDCGYLKEVGIQKVTILGWDGLSQNTTQLNRGLVYYKKIGDKGIYSGKPVCFHINYTLLEESIINILKEEVRNKTLETKRVVWGIGDSGDSGILKFGGSDAGGNTNG